MLVDNMYHDKISVLVWILIVGSVYYFVALAYTMSFATRVKTEALFKNTVIYRILGFAKKYIKKIYEFLKYIFANISLVYKTVILLAGVALLEIIFVMILSGFYWYLDIGWVLALLIGINILLFPSALYVSVILQKIKKGGEKIASGDLEHKIDTKHMFGDFKSFADSFI